jgi:acyl-CoA thioesterase FadM
MFVYEPIESDLMNLYLRLIWAMLRAWRLPRITPGDTITRTLRVFPNDIDINGHMNNGRYHTIVDLMLIEYFVRTGYAQAMLKAGWKPMSGGALISYRKGLQPFQSYTLSFTLEAADEVWNYMRYEFRRRDGGLCAVGYMKGAAVGREGLVRNETSYARAGREFVAKPLPPCIHQWIQAESSLMQTV